MADCVEFDIIRQNFYTFSNLKLIAVFLHCSVFCSKFDYGSVVYCSAKIIPFQTRTCSQCYPSTGTSIHHFCMFIFMLPCSWHWMYVCDEYQQWFLYYAMASSLLFV